MSSAGAGGGQDAPQELDLGLPRTEVTPGLDRDLAAIIREVTGRLPVVALDEVIAAMDALDGNLATPAGQQFTERIRLACYRTIRQLWREPR